MKTYKPQSAGGSIYEHIREAQERMKRDDVKDAEFIFNGVKVPLSIHSWPHDIALIYSMQRAINAAY